MLPQKSISRFSSQILWEPFPHTGVFFSFLSHLGPLQASAAPLLLTPSSDLLPQPLDSGTPQVCKQPLKFPVDLLVDCHLQPEAFGGKWKNPEPGGFGCEPWGRCMGVKCPHHGAWQATSTNEDKPVGKTVHLSPTSVLDEEDSRPVSLKKDVCSRLCRTHLDFRANPGGNSSTSAVGWSSAAGSWTKELPVGVC